MSNGDEYDYSGDEGAGFELAPAPTPRDCANVLLGPIELDMQLAAIRSLLHRNRAEDARLLTQLEEIDRRARSLRGMANERAVDHYGEVFYETVYQSGTHALAAVGMVAPLTESVLVRLFGCILRMGDPKRQHPRWNVDDADPNKWNCKFRWDQEKSEWQDNIVAGVDQMAKMINIDTILSPEDRQRLRALFSYRNYMFHNGMEWPDERVAAFDRLVGTWPAGWFTSARSGDRPWIFYMTQAFTDDCLALLERFADGVGAMFMRWNESSGLSFDGLLQDAKPSSGRPA